MTSMFVTFLRDVILLVHQLSVILTNAMNKFYQKQYIGALLAEGVKFCVPCRK